MEIKLNINVESLGRIGGTKAQKMESQAVSDVTPSFAQSEALNQELRRTPDIRPDVVLNARQLVGDHSYPASEIIKKIASLLAKSIGNEA